jgi:hypothetical protein
MSAVSRRPAKVLAVTGAVLSTLIGGGYDGQATPGGMPLLELSYPATSARGGFGVRVALPIPALWERPLLTVADNWIKLL